MYDVHYQRWVEDMIRNRLEYILLLNSDELMTKPLPLLHKVDAILNVPHYFKDNMFVMNETKGIYCWKRSATSDEPEDIKVDLIQQHSQRTSWLHMSKRFVT